MSAAPFIAAAIPSALALALAVWLSVRIIRARTPVRIEARIDRQPRR